MVLALSKPVPWAQYVIVTQSLLTHSVSRISLFFFSSTCLGLFRSVGSLLSFSAHSALPQCLFLLHGLFLHELFLHRLLWRNTSTSLVDEQVPVLLQGPVLGRAYSPVSSWLLVLFVILAEMVVPQLLHSHMVGQSTQSWPGAASFLGKHSAYHSSLGWVVSR